MSKSTVIFVLILSFVAWFSGNAEAVVRSVVQVIVFLLMCSGILFLAKRLIKAGYAIPFGKYIEPKSVAHINHGKISLDNFPHQLDRVYDEAIKALSFGDELLMERDAKFAKHIGVWFYGRSNNDAPPYLTALIEKKIIWEYSKIRPDGIFDKDDIAKVNFVKVIEPIKESELKEFQAFCAKLW